MERRAAPTRNHPYSVSQLTWMIKNLLEDSFPKVWLVGEISNFKRAGSGHWYFSLKDGDSQVRCTMWRSATGNVPFQPRDGQEVLVMGQLNVYAPRGEYSVAVQHMEDFGVGKLRAAFEAMKARLEQEGLFDVGHKRPLPLLPRKIGIVTSPTGAALRDILRVLKNRFAGVHVLIYPARVQGDGAAAEIADGIGFLDHFGECDLIIVGRGGGSEEDLWCFNEEIVARALFASETPTISAVGHETDVTIADFVADVRAATPSNGAEIAVRSIVEYRQSVTLHTRAMERAMTARMAHLRSRVQMSGHNPIFNAVRSRLNDAQRTLAELDARLERAPDQILHPRGLRLIRAGEALNIEHLAARAKLLEQRLKSALKDMEGRLDGKQRHAQQRLVTLMHRLDDLSPLKVLARGYAAVFDERDRALRDPAEIPVGARIRVRLEKGELQARVMEKQAPEIQEDLFS